MTIEYQLTPDDQRRYLRWLWRSPLMLTCQIIVMVGLYVSFGAAIYHSRPNIFPTFTVIFFLFYLLLFFGSYWVTALLQVQSMKRRGLFGQVRLTLSEQGITRLYGQQTKQGDQYPWQSFQRYREMKDAFLLQLQPQTIVIPKHSLSKKQMKNLRSTLQQYEARLYG